MVDLFGRFRDGAERQSHVVVVAAVVESVTPPAPTRNIGGNKDAVAIHSLMNGYHEVVLVAF